MKKEATDRVIIIKVRKSLFDDFFKFCEEDYKTISEGLRDLITTYVKKRKSKELNE